jgi:hypothetical protein
MWNQQEVSPFESMLVASDSWSEQSILREQQGFVVFDKRGSIRRDLPNDHVSLIENQRTSIIGMYPLVLKPIVDLGSGIPH